MITSMLDNELALAMQLAVKGFPATGRLLETGTGYGHSARFFAKLLPGWHIYTVDAFGLFGDGRIYQKLNHDQVLKVVQYYNDCPNITQVLGNSSTIGWELDLDILYLDADHTYQGCLADYQKFVPFLKPGGMLIFDDYLQPSNPTNGVKRVVEEHVHWRLVGYFGNAVIFTKTLP